MQKVQSDSDVNPLKKIEVTALIIFSAVMFYLLANVFLIPYKNLTPSSKLTQIENNPEIKLSDHTRETLENVSTQADSSKTQSSNESNSVVDEALSNNTIANNVTDSKITDSIQVNLETQTNDINELKKQTFDAEHQAQVHAINDMCKNIDEKLGSVTLQECDTAKLKHSGAVSTNNKPLAYRDFVTGSDSANKTRVMLIGGIHGDEFSGVSISFKWLHNLAKAYDRQSSDEIDNMHWRVIPVLNPDGLLRPDGESHRMNANDVDLNRNFPTPDWDELAIKFWKEKRYSDKRRFPGPGPGSEIETQWIVDQFEEFKPHAVISIHAPYGIVDADGPTEPPPNVGPLQLKLLGTYPGSMGRYVGVYKNLSMLTVELKHAGIMPSNKDIDHIWADILNWIDEKVVRRDNTQSDSDSALQSMRHEINGTTREIVIDKKAGD